MFEKNFEKKHLNGDKQTGLNKIISLIGKTPIFSGMVGEP
jgi:hypothetical protein